MFTAAAHALPTHADPDHMGFDPQPVPPNAPFPAGLKGQRASGAPVACPAVTLGPAEPHRRTCSSSHGELGIALSVAAQML